MKEKTKVTIYKKKGTKSEKRDSLASLTQRSNELLTLYVYKICYLDYKASFMENQKKLKTILKEHMNTPQTFGDL